MAEWFQVFIVAVIAALLIEARISFGTRIAVMEERLLWLIASLKKWGLVAPGDDVAIRMASTPEQDQRPSEPVPPRR